MGGAVWKGGGDKGWAGHSEEILAWKYLYSLNKKYGDMTPLQQLTAVQRYTGAWHF